MKLIKTSLFTSISTATTIISGIVVTKYVAATIGPAGMSYVGQYQNTIAILSMFSTLAITTGVIKYLAEYSGQTEKQQNIIATSLAIVIVASLIISVFVFFSNSYLSLKVFHTDRFSDIFLLYAFFVSIIVINTLISAFYNGLKEIRILTVISIVSSLTGISITIFLASKLGLKGVLIASNFTALMIFIANIFIIYNKKIISPQYIKKWNAPVAKLLMSFTGMGVVSGMVMPLSQLLIRDKIILSLSANEAGWWQAITRISDNYLAFITTVLSIYYLPKLSEIKTKAELKNEIIAGYKVILPVVGGMAFLIWLCKILVVHILFSKEFLPMIPLFKFQLLGDFFKIGSWLLGYVLIAKAAIKMMIVTEIFFSLSFVCLSYFFIDRFGVIGTTYAFCINYALYWITMFFATKKYYH